jgi:hypothetical protein
MMPHYGARSLCARALAEPDPDRLASPWQTDADLGRPIEVVSDMSRSRRLGFTEYHPTDDAFFARSAYKAALRPRLRMTHSLLCSTGSVPSV